MATAPARDRLGGELGLWRTLVYALRLCTSASGPTFLALSALTLVGAAMAPVVVILARDLVDAIATAAAKDTPSSTLVAGAVMLGLATRIQTMAASIASNHLGILSMDVTQRAEQEFYAKSVEVDMALLDDASWHDRMARASQDITYRPAQLAVILFGLLRSGVALLGLFGVLLSLHPLLMLFAVVATLPTMVISKWVYRQLAANQRETISLMREKGYIGGLMVEPAAAKEVRAFDLGRFLLGRHDQLEKIVRNKYAAVVWRTHWGLLIAGVIPAGAMIGAYAFVAQQGRTGRFGPGVLAAIIAGYASVLAFMGEFVGYLNQLDQHNALFLQHYFEFLRSPAAVPAPEHPQPLPARLDDGIRLQGLSFTYPFGTEPALTDINLHLRPGELLAIVGENGAGKTTLVKLLLRFYLAQEGRLLVGGVDVVDVAPSELRARFGVLFQDFVRYELTARETVTIARPDGAAEDARVVDALRTARADGVVDRLRDGLDTRIGRLFDGGHDLSGGEWQRLALARLIYRDADIWILDEPTASLDPEAEAAIFGELRRLLAGRMGIVISHRFSTVRIADRIAVLEAGRLVEVGAHDELIARGGRYAELFELQAAGYR